MFYRYCVLSVEPHGLRKINLFRPISCLRLLYFWMKYMGKYFCALHYSFSSPTTLVVVLLVFSFVYFSIILENYSLFPFSLHFLYILSRLLVFIFRAYLQYSFLHLKRRCSQLYPFQFYHEMFHWLYLILPIKIFFFFIHPV